MISLVYTETEHGIDVPILPDLTDSDLITTAITIMSYFADYMGFFVGLFFRSFQVPILNIVLIVSTVIAMFIFITEVLIPILKALPTT